MRLHVLCLLFASLALPPQWAGGDSFPPALAAESADPARLEVLLPEDPGQDPRLRALSVSQRDAPTAPVAHRAPLSCPHCGRPRCVGCAAPGGAAAPSPCATSHKPLFYLNDFSYLDNPAFQGSCLGDELKRMQVADWGTLDIGGQYRARQHHEVGMKGTTRFLNNTDDFLLNRMRMFANYDSGSWLRLYVEGIYAGSSFQNYPTRPIDVNEGDLLNAFVDLRLCDESTLRVGRQELLYGAQRTVSPLDWANTRRTFEGVRLLNTVGDWTADLFYTNLVVVAPYEFDEPDYDQSFYGAYTVYNGFENATVDLYYLGYDNQTAGFSLHTLGNRWLVTKGQWLFEVEGGYQFGDAAGFGVRQNAGFLTGGIGRVLSPNGWKPTLWMYYDYASGDAASSSSFNGYNQLFPLAHKYLGFIDALQRTNIESPNVLLTMSPTAKSGILFWYYYFQSDTAAPISSIGGTPPQNGNKYVGQEVDLLFTYRIKPRAGIGLGYSHFWPGGKILNRHAANFLYTEFTVDF